MIEWTNHGRGRVFPYVGKLNGVIVGHLGESGRLKFDLTGYDSYENSKEEAQEKVEGLLRKWLDRAGLTLKKEEEI